MAKLVNWHSFVQRIREKKIFLFSNLDIRRIFGVSTTAAVLLLHRYSKKGFIIRVKRGLYAMPDVLPPDFYVANKIYEQSYVSLDSALSYHGVIPEAVYEITSVTTKAPRRFRALGKIFSYRKMRMGAFTGYAIERQSGVSFRIAEPEKAFVDANYFRLLDGREPLTRFDKRKIAAAKAKRYAKFFNNKKLTAVIEQTLR